MTTLREIKGHIGGVENIKKVTGALKIVSATKRKRLERFLERHQDFNKEILNLMGRLKGYPELKKSRFLLGNKNAPLLLVINTSDRGLCGGLNNSIFSFFKDNLLRENSLESWRFLLIGHKGYRYFSRYKENILKSFDIKNMTITKVWDEVAGFIFSLFDEGKISGVSILTNVPQGRSTSQVKLRKILPVEIEEKSQILEIDYFVEERIESFFRDLIFTYIATSVYNSIIESNLAEEVARMMSMDMATKNAEEFIDDLRLDYHRIRQSVITQEILDVIGGLL